MAKNGLYFIFNFIEKPVVIPPFKSYVESWFQTVLYVRKNPQFLSTQLHRNLNPKGKSILMTPKLQWLLMFYVVRVPRCRLNTAVVQVRKKNKEGVLKSTSI